MSKTIRVLIVEPFKAPYPADIDNTLKGMQKIVGGLIEPISLENGVDLVGNEEAKLMELPGNRSLGNDIIAGTFFVTGSNSKGDFVSLPEDKLQKYAAMFQKPEVFTKEQVEETIGFSFINFL